MSSEATAATPRSPAWSQILYPPPPKSLLPRWPRPSSSLRRQTCGCSDVPWVDGVNIPMALVVPNSVWRMCPGGPLAFPIKFPRVQAPAAACVCRHSGVGHPGGPDHQPLGVAQKISSAQETGLCCFFFYFIQNNFSNLSADLASRVLPRLWVQCWVGCPI